MAKNHKATDPRGHSIRVYDNIYDSPAFKALSPHDVMAYLALLRELKSYNNGDLSLTLSRAKECGISHHVTLARSLRALCAVGLTAITRKGGSTKGGQRLATLYRMTDRECYDIPKKGLEAMAPTNEWQKVGTVEQGHAFIQMAEAAAKNEGKKLQTLGHAVTATTSPDVVVSAKTTTRCDTWDGRPLHAVTHGKNSANPILARVCGRFDPEPQNPIHRTPRVPPLYIATPGGDMAVLLHDADAAKHDQHIGGDGRYLRLVAKPQRLFTQLLDDDQDKPVMQLAQLAVHRTAQPAMESMVP